MEERLFIFQIMFGTWVYDVCHINITYYINVKENWFINGFLYTSFNIMFTFKFQRT